MACLKRPIEMSHEFLSEILNKESILIDATVGNGNDTLFLPLKLLRFMLLIFKKKQLNPADKS